MKDIDDIVSGIYKNQRDIWVVEWWLDDQGIRHFHVGTLDTNLNSSVKNYIDGKNSSHHILGFAADIDSAHFLIEEFKRKISPDNIVNFKG
ncbi:hypothetical protein [Pseudomonas aeruginosa]|uniref:hypothetical protein n=1 Tax=Pseudomonas aeruginosa TaxID=287 RepID=UPI0021E76104|nr:hypothetical protein [Pseudomonas aeruginosa]MCV3784854.1 hypothetical protein [Pseudomonas aeruginosa]MCV3827876.1 hypothetical protein [Pseudomonas aeruginosa]